MQTSIAILIKNVVSSSWNKFPNCFKWAIKVDFNIMITEIYFLVVGNKNQGKSRILTVKYTPDAPFQYLPIMNCIFTAQKYVSE